MDTRDFDFDFERLRDYRPPPYAGALLFAAIVVVVVLAAGFTCFFSVPQDSTAVVKRFGAVTGTAGPGLHFKLPFGIDKHYVVPTERVLKEEFGFRTVQAGQRTEYEKSPQMREDESLMLTGDLNIIDVEWVVQYRIIDPDKWLHQVRDPVATIRDVSEAVMRRIVGNHLSSESLTVARAEIAEQTKVEMQHILDDDRPEAPGGDYDMGIHIGSIEMQDVTPPDSVKPAFNEVNKARQEQQRLINQAERKYNQVIPKARGQADQTISEAEGYKAERVNAAHGEAARFTAILAEYRNAEDVTRRRLYLEMIDQVMPNVGRIYIMEGEQRGPLPLLDLEGAAGRRGTRQ